MKTLQLLSQVIKATENNIHYAHFIVRGKAFAILHDMLGKLYKDLSEDYDLYTEKLIELYIPPINSNRIDWNDPKLKEFDNINLIDDHYAPVLKYCFDSISFMLKIAGDANTSAEKFGNWGLSNLLGDFIQKYEHWLNFTITRSYEEDL